MWTETEIARAKGARDGGRHASDSRETEWRPTLTGTGGLPVTAQARAAGIQDRDGAPASLASIRAGFPWLRHVFADGAYAGPKLQAALEGKGRWRIEVVKRSGTMRGFEPSPRRWVVERTLAWPIRPRRPDKDFEATIATAQAWLFIGNVQLLIRRMVAAVSHRCWHARATLSGRSCRLRDRVRAAEQPERTLDAPATFP